MSAAVGTETVGFAAWAAIGLAALACELAGRRSAHRLPTLSDLVGTLVAARPVRLVVLAVWLWLGVHLFAR